MSLTGESWARSRTGRRRLRLCCRTPRKSSWRAVSTGLPISWNCTTVGFARELAFCTWLMLVHCSSPFPQKFVDRAEGNIQFNLMALSSAEGSD